MYFDYIDFTHVQHLIEHSSTSQGIFQKNYAALVTHVVKRLAKT